MADPGGVGRIANDSYPCHARRNLFKEFEPFPSYAVLERSKSGSITARTCQASDVTSTDRVNDIREHVFRSTLEFTVVVIAVIARSPLLSASEWKPRILKEDSK